MASIVLLLSELLGGESASVLAADRYIMGGERLGLGELRQAVASASAPAPAPARQDGDGRLADQRPEGKMQRKEELFEDLGVSRIAVDLMWP